MDTAKLFMTGRSQAVRLPKAYRMEGEEVLIKRVGNAVVLMPRSIGWDTLFRAVEQFEPGFSIEREQPEQHQKRRRLR